MYIGGIFNAAFSYKNVSFMNAVAKPLVFVLKINSLGNVLWGYQTTNTGGAVGHKVLLALDDDYKVYVATSFEVSMSVGVVLNSAGGSDIAIIKLNADGTYNSAISFGGAFNDRVVGMYRAPSGSSDIILAGNFAGLFSISGTPFSSISNSVDMFVVRFSKDLSFRARATFGGSDTDELIDVTVDNNALYLVGFYYATATFKTATTSNGVNDIILFKVWATDFSVAWQYVAGGTQQDEGKSVGIDVANNLVYISGIFTNTVNFGPATYSLGSDYNYFLVQINTDTGLPIWAIQGGSIGGSTDYGNAITVDHLGNIYLAGTGGAPMTFGQYVKISGTDFVAKVNPMGTVLWLTGSANANVEPYALTHAGNGNIIITGLSSNAGTFGSLPISSVGGKDILIARIDTTCAGCQVGMSYLYLTML